MRDNIAAVAKATGRAVNEVTVCILNRPRHHELIAQVHQAGVRVRLLSDGDVLGAVAAAMDDASADLLLGTGGTPEGVISACAVKALGGAMQARLAPTTPMKSNWRSQGADSWTECSPPTTRSVGEQPTLQQPGSPTGHH